MLRNGFSLKHLSMVMFRWFTRLGLFTKDTGYQKKSVVKTLLNIFLTVKTEWPNVSTPKKFFDGFKI